MNMNDIELFSYNKNCNELKSKFSLNKKNINLFAYISFIKIISAFLVILKHTNRNYWKFNQYWVSTNVMCSFCMCAVPLFSLCIGATLLDFNEKYNIKEFWKRRFKKVVLPIMGWNIIYYYYRIYIIKNFKRPNLNLITIYNIYFKSNLYPIINSLRVFIIGYMIIPLIAYVNKTNKIKIYSYCFLLLFINQSLIPYLMKYFENYKLSWPYNYNVGYIIYIFAGYLIHNNKFHPKFKLLIYCSGIIGLLLRLVVSHYLTMKNKKPDKTEINYIGLPIVMYSCAVFLFIKENFDCLFKNFNLFYINIIGSLSMGPFFLHYIIIWGLPHLFNYNEWSFYFRFFGAFLVSFICFIITFLIKKIPIIKFLTP